MKRHNTPRLRFGGFAGEWERKTIGELGDVVTGNTPTTSNNENYEKNGLLWVTPTDIKEPITTKTAKQLSEKGKKLARLLPPNSILVTCIASIGKNTLIETCGSCNQQINALIPKKEFHPYFLLTLSEFWSVQMKKIAGSGTMDIVNKTQFSEIETYLPNKEEQTALGNFFRRLDETLAQERARLAKTRQLKRAMLAKLFPAHGETAPKLRFKGFSGDWERKTLGDLAEIVRGASPRPIQDPKWFDDDSDIGWLRIADVSNQNGRIHYLEQKISKAGQEKTRVLEEPHLLLSIAASVGKPVINYVKTGVHDGFLIFKNPKFELEFMFQYLDSFADKWQSFGQPGTQVNLNSDIVKNAELFIPPTPEEQTAIGNFFQKLDQTLALQSAALEKLTRLKKALLAAMLV